MKSIRKINIPNFSVPENMKLMLWEPWRTILKTNNLFMLPLVGIC
jgi:hypothetical protein